MGARRAAREVAEGRAEQGVVCCWTGTGASIAANKVAGVRAALCADAPTAAGARRWNDANVLALSLRATCEAELEEILDAWFSAAASPEPDDRDNVAASRRDRVGQAALAAPARSAVDAPAQVAAKRTTSLRSCSVARPSASSRSTWPSTSESVR